MLYPDVLKALETVRAVFQILPGWQDSYTKHLAKMEIPDSFKNASGPAPPGHLACCLTAWMKGAQLLEDTIPETSLQVHPPKSKDTLCMVIKGIEGGKLCNWLHTECGEIFQERADSECSVARWHSRERSISAF